MLDSLIVAIPIATLLGFLSALGTGGGSLLILWLTMAVGLPQDTARAINLMFFIPSALIACIFRKQQGSVDFKKIWPTIAAGCACALLFSWIGTDLDVSILKKLFGALLIFTGVRELLYRPR